MRKDITVKINTNTSRVIKTDSVLGISGENLQGNLIFELDEFIQGQAYIEIQQNSKKNLIPLKLEDDKYILPIKNSLLTCDMLNMNFLIKETSDLEQTPIFKSEIMTFRVANSINATETIKDDYPNILDVIDSKQDKLISGINIKTINNKSLLGEGNISISGSGGTADYEELENKPSINSVELVGNKTLDELNIQQKGDYPQEALSNVEIEEIINSCV